MDRYEMLILYLLLYPQPGEYLTLDTNFYSLRSKPEAVAASLTTAFSSLSHYSRRLIIEIYHKNNYIL
jgi:hypothetical protein